MKDTLKTKEVYGFASGADVAATHNFKAAFFVERLGGLEKSPQPLKNLLNHRLAEGLLSLQPRLLRLLNLGFQQPQLMGDLGQFRALTHSIERLIR